MSDEIRIGTLATLVGPYAGGGEEGMRGLDMAISEFGGQIAGKKLAVFKESTDASPETAEVMADLLFDKHNIDILIGPLSGNEGIMMRDYAKTKPNKTFINGIAGAQDITLRNPAPNFFNFTTNGVQWMAGLAEYVINQQGYKRVVTLAEDYSYPHGQVAGFILTFQRLGGVIVDRFWVPLGTRNYGKIVEAIPTDIDAIFVALGGTDAIDFLQQYDNTGRKTPLIGGSITIDQTVLGTRGELSERLLGTASSGPLADNNPAPNWQRFVTSYHEQFPHGLSTPSLFAWGYYVNTKATLLALEKVEGDLSDDHERLRHFLRVMEFVTPTGPVKLDHNRQAIAIIFCDSCG
ncbi:MAG: ABC transporter substrate-binding protein [Anaerolineae bacterium]